MTPTIKRILACSLIASTALCGSITASANDGPNAKSQKIMDFWTTDKMKNATARDMVIDHRGLGYMRRSDGTLQPYGHSKRAVLKVTKAKRVPQAKPSNPGGGDSTPPAIMSMSPANGATIGASHTFSATVTDAGGVKSVVFEVTYAGGSQNITATHTGNDVWSSTLSGFPAGAGSWRVVAKDNAKKGGNTSTSQTLSFTVETDGGGGGGGGDIVTNSHWGNGGAVQTAAGRLFYQMPTNRRKSRWAGYVCSGTVATDGVTGRSVIITASHCVFNDDYKAFARNVLFIPNQDQTTGSATDSNCSNDPVGCWTTSFGVVDVNWTTRKFPDNIPWDYAYYVVDDNGSHSGNGSTSDALDTAVGALGIDFSAPAVNDGTASPFSADFTHGLGYSYSDDPNFMYCAEDMTTEGTDNWWLSQCGLSGGASGGPWVQPMNESNGSGPIISVNSWGYNTSPGMAGPKLSGTSAECIFTNAKTVSFASIPTNDGDQGLIVSNCP